MAKVLIFNPLNEDVSVKYDASGKNPRTFTFRAKEVGKIDKEFADHVKKHLANRIFDKRGDYRKDRDMQMKEIYKEMEDFKLK